MSLPFRAIAVFHAVARNGSLTKAADELFVTTSAVSQQIQNLEAHLGTTLLTKAGRGIVLTEAGERYFEMIADEVERISEATQRIRGFRSRSVLVVRSTPSLATKWLRPRLGRFLDANPDVELRLNGTNEPTDFSREAVDIEIRHGEGRWPGLFVEGLAEESFLPVCSPSLAASGSMTAADVSRHRLIYSFKSQVQWPQWFSLAGVPPAEESRRVLFDRSHMSVDAAAEGMGIALESTLMMWRELCAGTLICPVEAPPPIKLTTQWIVCPLEHLNKRKVKTFIDWLRVEKQDWQDQIGALGLPTTV
ncbi:LysR substrate-binding domain-containing protein [Propionivibrio dicarboxylicus]|uniref:DNA-binding transcriptional regulator, LysR family n=1 Tax=Propionivibrio dicarboxylicus TaxID=83767 RepID=A0A1G8KDE3_9RHOO|nr:LysR substrate-binding domain-containing protein [Propionivibrio dicarboxylicus]SDI41447.1 DNA-binding transcriptional regulator, LysR family [Propionivibrio dicarboxylicus]